MSPRPRKFVKKNGINVLNPEYLAWKNKGGTVTQGPWVDPIDKMTVLIQVLEANDLVGKDRSMFGKKKTSDPYVSVSLKCTPTNPLPGQMQIRPQVIYLGKTPTIKKNLNPTWNHSLSMTIPYSRSNESLMLLFQLYDEDKFSSDDSLGVVALGPLQWKDSAGSASWYEIPKGSAKKVSGKIKLSIQTQIHRVQGLKPYC